MVLLNLQQQSCRVIANSVDINLIEEYLPYLTSSNAACILNQLSDTKLHAISHDHACVLSAWRFRCKSLLSNEIVPEWNSIDSYKSIYWSNVATEMIKHPNTVAGQKFLRRTVLQVQRYIVRITVFQEFSFNLALILKEFTYLDTIHLYKLKPGLNYKYITVLRLRDIKFSFTSITEDMMEWILNSILVGKCTQLHFKACRFENEIMEKYVPQWGKLNTIEMDASIGQMLSMDCVRHIGHLNNVTKLILSGLHITDKHSVHFNNYRNCTKLYIDVSNNSLSGIGIGFLQYCTSLVHVNVSHNSIQDAGARTIASMPCWHALEQLEIHDCNITSEGMKVLFRSIKEYAKKLDYLDIGANFVGKEAGKLLANVLNAKNARFLSVLKMAYIGIGQSGATVEFLDALACRKDVLKVLDISENRIGGDVVVKMWKSLLSFDMKKSSALEQFICPANFIHDTHVQQLTQLLHECVDQRQEFAQSKRNSYEIKPYNLRYMDITYNRISHPATLAHLRKQVATVISNAQHEA